MQDSNTENTHPIRSNRGIEETIPTYIQTKTAEEPPAGEVTQATPVSGPEEKRPRRWPVFLIGLVFVLASIGAGGFFGYREAIRMRQAKMEEQKIAVATEHFLLGMVAHGNKQYDIARQQYEYVIRLDPTFPGVTDKLREVMIEMAIVQTPTLAPTNEIPTLTPTPDTRPQEEIYAQARQQYANKEWDLLFQTIDSLRKIDPKFHAVDIDGMMYMAYRFRGIDKIIINANLEGGLYDLAMSERFAPLDVDALGYRNWARMYLNGTSFWGVDWMRVMAYFEEIYPYFPNMRDSSGMTAIERYRQAARGQADKLFNSGDYCGAYEYYEKSLQAGPDGSLEPRVTEAYLGCYPPTETPTPTLEFTPTVLLPTAETPTLESTPIPQETATSEPPPAETTEPAPPPAP